MPADEPWLSFKIIWARELSTHFIFALLIFRGEKQGTWSYAQRCWGMKPVSFNYIKMIVTVEQCGLCQLINQGCHSRSLMCVHENNIICNMALLTNLCADQDKCFYGLNRVYI